MTNVHFDTNECVHNQRQRRSRRRRRNKILAETVIVKIHLFQVFCQSAIREIRARVAGYLCLAALVGILGWREQVMAFWSALIYTPPFLSLSSVKRWERGGAASSPVSCTCLGWEDQLWTLTSYLPQCTFITHPVEYIHQVSERKGYSFAHSSQTVVWQSCTNAELSCRKCMKLWLYKSKRKVYFKKIRVYCKTMWMLVSVVTFHLNDLEELLFS